MGTGLQSSSSKTQNISKSCLTINYKKEKTYSLFFFFFFGSLGTDPWHMEVPRKGAESELHGLTYATTTAMPDPSHICDLHHSS